MTRSMDWSNGSSRGGPLARRRCRSPLLWDLVVVGGGPAGASAARAACEEGARVVLIDRSRRPPLAEAVPGVAQRWLDTIDPSGGARRATEPVDHVERSWGGLSVQDGPFIIDPDAGTRLLARPALDAALRSGAAHAGTTVRLATIVSSVRRSLGWRVVLDDGEHLDAARLLLATGRQAVPEAIRSQRLVDEPLVALAASWPDSKGR